MAETTTDGKTKEEVELNKQTAGKAHRISGLKLLSEIWVLICQIVSAGYIFKATTLPDHSTWTLLVLYGTSVITIIQFYDGLDDSEIDFFSKIVIIIYVIVTILLVVSFLSGFFASFVESLLFVKSAIIIPPIRQFIFVVLSIWGKKK